MLKIFTTTMMLAGSLAFATTAYAQSNSEAQPISPPSFTPQTAGGNGATTMWAYIDADGTHVPGDGGLGLASSQKIGTGQYEVIFKRDIGSSCSYVGSMSELSSGTAHGMIGVVRRGGNNKGVWVQTYDETGTFADRNFGVLVSCYR